MMFVVALEEQRKGSILVPKKVNFACVFILRVGTED